MTTELYSRLRLVLVPLVVVTFGLIALGSTRQQPADHDRPGSSSL